jgi:hypothetical protein
MLGTNCPGDDRWDAPDAGPDGAPDAPQPVSAAGADRGAVLADARTRQEYDLAYRATVDAIYASAEREAGRAIAERFEELPSVVDKYPADYVPATHEPPRVDGPYEHPEKWVRRINVDENLPGRDINCGECARAACSTWYGKPTAAAAISVEDSLGETPSRMEEWAGHPSLPATMAEVERRLEELGAGSSAIVGCKWNGRGGHWFNAFNDAGTVKTVDAQSDLVSSWPPSQDGVGFDESQMRLSDAIFFDPDGKVLRNDHA